MEKKKESEANANNFAKILYTPTYMVLVKKEVSMETDEFNFTTSIWDKGNEFKNTYSYECEDTRDQAYDFFDKEMALEFVTAMGSFISFAS